MVCFSLLFSLLVKCVPLAEHMAWCKKVIRDSPSSRRNACMPSREKDLPSNINIRLHPHGSGARSRIIPVPVPTMFSRRHPRSSCQGYSPIPSTILPISAKAASTSTPLPATSLTLWRKRHRNSVFTKPLIRTALPAIRKFQIRRIWDIQFRIMNLSN